MSVQYEMSEEMLDEQERLIDTRIAYLSTQHLEQQECDVEVKKRLHKKSNQLKEKIATLQRRIYNDD